jgi:hypothetical protein
MPAKPKANPFKPVEFRSIMVSVRLTPTEYAAIEAEARKRKIDMAELLRLGLGLVLDQSAKGRSV